MLSEYDAFRSLATPPAEPASAAEGEYVLVPREATEEMRFQGAGQLRPYMPISQESARMLMEDMGDAWDAMLAAVPDPAQSAEAGIPVSEQIQELAAQSADTPSDAPPPIESNETYADRFYIPLPGGWEIQTKGGGSSFRICDTKSGWRLPITSQPYLYETLERMGREVHAAWSALAPRPPSDTPSDPRAAHAVIGGLPSSSPFRSASRPRPARDGLLSALVAAEAALADIGDADREPSDDLAWCEKRAAEALPIIRKAIADAGEQPARGGNWQAPFHANRTGFGYADRIDDVNDKTLVHLNTVTMRNESEGGAKRDADTGLLDRAGER
jgi:hypothetical protein